MNTPIKNDLHLILTFLHCPTPTEWLISAAQNIPLLLIDHAHCERKAATSALNFICKYSRHRDIVSMMSPLAREELLHFEKVMKLMDARNIAFSPLKPSKYAQKLHQHVIQNDYFQHVTDELIIGAIIEARSCERFNALIPWLDDPALAKFYASLVQAEARHFIDYLDLAKLYSPSKIDERVHFFLEIEQQLIKANDPLFRFHGGIPTLDVN